MLTGQGPDRGAGLLPGSGDRVLNDYVDLLPGLKKPYSTKPDGGIAYITRS